MALSAVGDSAQQPPAHQPPPQGPSAQLQQARALAWAAIFLYPVGVPLLCALLLFRCRSALFYDEATPLSRATAILHREYRQRDLYRR